MLQTKRFIGNDLGRLYRRIRAELGPDALVFSTRTLHRADGPPLIEIQAAPPASDDALPLELQQAMLSTVLSRVAPGLTVPDLEDLVLRGVLGPAAAGEEDTFDEAAPPDAPFEFVPGPLLDAQPGPPVEPVPAFEPPLPAGDPSPATTEDLLRQAGLELAADRIAAAAPGQPPEKALSAFLRALPVSYPDEYETAIVTVDGPSGSGRTTSLLRMALDCAEAGRNAILVAADGSHSGAVQRLAGYAEVMALDFVDAVDESSLRKAVNKAPRGSVLFVDGPPQWSPPAGVRAPLFRYLAIPCHWQAGTVETWRAALTSASFAGAIPTFFDLATDLTLLVSTLVAIDCGIAFLSSGSDISTGIEVANPRELASGFFSMPNGGRTDGRLVASA